MMKIDQRDRKIIKAIITFFISPLYVFVGLIKEWPLVFIMGIIFFFCGTIYVTHPSMKGGVDES